MLTIPFEMSEFDFNFGDCYLFAVAMHRIYGRKDNFTR